MKIRTTEDFIRRAREVHGEKFDYSKVKFVDSKTKVCIVCPVHGETWQCAGLHLKSKFGCQRCSWDGQVIRYRYGVGVVDFVETENDLYKKALIVWKDILRRCYKTQEHKNFHTYKDCTICNEWKIFSNFYSWFLVNYIEGYDIDKDIIKQGNRVYSPDTCCFVPHIINSSILCKVKKKSEYPTGVWFNPERNLYEVKLRVNSNSQKFGRFKTLEEAVDAYKEWKTFYIRQLATNYYFNGKIDERVYKALLNYQVLP